MIGMTVSIGGVGSGCVLAAPMSSGGAPLFSVGKCLFLSPSLGLNRSLGKAG